MKEAKFICRNEYCNKNCKLSVMFEGDIATDELPRDCNIPRNEESAEWCIESITEVSE